MQRNRHEVNGSGHPILDHVRTTLQTLESLAHFADRRIAEVNQIVSEAESSGLLNPTVLLGEAMLKRSYPPSAEGHDSGELVQPALLVPQGLGALHWDSERFLDLSRQSEGLEAEAWTCFVPASQCKPAVRALIAVQVDGLLERFVELVDRCGI